MIPYLNNHSKNIMLFRCFEDKDLKISSRFSEKTISHVKLTIYIIKYILSPLTMM